MKKNIGKTDRVVRFMLGVIALIVAFFVTGWILKIFLIFVVALFCFYQAFVGWCFLYHLIGKNTCPID